MNVILCLDEFQHEGTQFRRARHVCDVRWSVPPKDVFMEIDTGELRIVETSPLTVRRMPHEFAHFSTPILECRFEGAKVKNIREKFKVQQKISAKIRYLTQILQF